MILECFTRGMWRWTFLFFSVSLKRMVFWSLLSNRCLSDGKHAGFAKECKWTSKSRSSRKIVHPGKVVLRGNIGTKIVLRSVVLRAMSLPLGKDVLSEELSGRSFPSFVSFQFQSFGTRNPIMSTSDSLLSLLIFLSQLNSFNFPFLHQWSSFSPLHP